MEGGKEDAEREGAEEGEAIKWFLRKIWCCFCIGPWIGF